MASASVKSFRIEDILVDKNENRAEAANILASLSGECQRTATDNGRQNDNDVRDRQATSEAGSSRASTPFGGGGIVDTRKTSSTSGSPVSSSEDDRSDKSSAAEERRPSTEIKYNAAAATLPSGFYHPFTGFPMGFPLANMPGAGTSASLTETGSAIRNFPPGMFPGNFDALRQNRFLYGGPPSALLLPTMPRLSHPGHLPQGAGYPIYPNFTGLFGLPLAGGLPGYPDKGRLPGDRDNYPVYHLGRPMYAMNCKRKGGQIRFSNSQTAMLEKAFIQQKYLNASDRKKLAHSLGLSDRQVKTWFQNRRAKLRKCKGGMCTESETSGGPSSTSPLVAHDDFITN